MRSYVVDELDAQTLNKLEVYLQQKGLNSGIEKLYWLPVATEYLSAIQKEHEVACGPYALGLEILEAGVRLELLIRARSILRCQCIDYVSPKHLLAVVEQLDQLLVTVCTNS